jgi:uncharacterized protein (DUF924 family)
MNPEDVLSFWLGELDPQGLATPEVSQRWWRKDREFDGQVRQQFEPLWQALQRGEYQSWLDDARGRLAYVIVLDQFSRNMFRDQPAAFAGDARALAAAAGGIERGHDRALPGVARVFLYMPFMHSEALPEQERGVALFTALRDESQGELRKQMANNARFAERHRDVIARWGRFPHRNHILGRTSTPEELAFLEQPGSSF